MTTSRAQNLFSNWALHLGLKKSSNGFVLGTILTRSQAFQRLLQDVTQRRKRRLNKKEKKKKLLWMQPKCVCSVLICVSAIRITEQIRAVCLFIDKVGYCPAFLVCLIYSLSLYAVIRLQKRSMSLNLNF